MISIDKKIKLLEMYRDGYKLKQMTEEVDLPLQTVKNFVYRNCPAIRQGNTSYLRKSAEKRVQKFMPYLEMWEEFTSTRDGAHTFRNEWIKFSGQSNYIANSWRHNLRMAMEAAGMEVPDSIKPGYFDFRNSRWGEKREYKGTMSKATCPHCGKEGGKSVMTRWHFDNCKKKVENNFK